MISSLGVLLESGGNSFLTSVELRREGKVSKLILVDVIGHAGASESLTLQRSLFTIPKSVEKVEWTERASKATVSKQ